MNATPPSEASSASLRTAGPSFSTTEIDDSCRLPLLVLFISAAVWLVIGSAFTLIASIKFHSPAFLADWSWLTYGRVHAASSNSMLYGFCLQAGFGIVLWMFCRLGGTTLAQPWLVTIGAKLWNLGATVGVIAILAGESTGFENLEMPRYAALIMFLGYLMMALWTTITFHRRRHLALIPSHWFLLTMASSMERNRGPERQIGRAHV